MFEVFTPCLPFSSKQEFIKDCWDSLKEKKWKGKLKKLSFKNFLISKYYFQKIKKFPLKYFSLAIAKKYLQKIQNNFSLNAYPEKAFKVSYYTLL